VVAVAAEPALVGAAGGRAALVSALPEPNTTTDEAHTFVETLLKNDQIAFDGRARAAKARRVGAVDGRQPHGLPTHKVVTRDGKKVLTRIRFACAHCD
jgi:hypothetical protein